MLAKSGRESILEMTIESQLKSARRRGKTEVL